MPRMIDSEVRAADKKLRKLLSSYEKGARFLSYREMMNRCGTTRRVIEHVLDQWRKEKLIWVEPQSGIYVNHNSQETTRRIVLMHSDWPSEYWQVLDARLEKAITALPGCTFIRKVVDPKAGKEFFRTINKKLGDVILLTYAFWKCNQADVARLLSAEIPIVFLENHISCHGVNCIDSEPEYTGMLAADHLLKNGHRKIAMIVSDSENLCVQRETTGFLRYLELHGVTPEIIYCHPAPCVSTQVWTECVMRSYLAKNGITFTACFVLSVFAALGVIHEIQAYGGTVPGDVSVIANTEVPSAALCSPPLTTVSRDFDKYVSEVINGVKNLFNKKPFGQHSARSFLVQRNSVRDLTKESCPTNVTVKKEDSI
ncbi:MAG: substrate-binding domain-containing protein [Victivallaceae bacterium]|nr:substrate-binding domain-containing protein [Victivallaceae bacterium]